MYKLHRILGSPLFACTLLSSQAAWAENEQGVHLVTKPMVGSIMHTKSVVKADAADTSLIVKYTQKSTIKAVKQNGDVVEETLVRDCVTSFGGVARNLPDLPPETTIHDKFGKIKQFRKVAVLAVASPEVTKLMETLSAFIMTDKAVKANDRWWTEVENPVVKGRTFTIEDAYLGLEKIDGKKCRKIKQTAEVIIDADGHKMSYEALGWIDPANGERVKVEATIKDVPTQTGPLTLKLASRVAQGDGKGKGKLTRPAHKDTDA